MSRRITVATSAALALFMAVLVVSVQPAAAASADLAVGSQHTTASDFNTATELNNVTVTGSGTSAYVELARSSSFTDGFEDEPADLGTPEAWEAVNAPNSQQVTTADAHSGSQSYQAGYRDQDQGTIRPAEQPYAPQIETNVSVWVKQVDTSAGADQAGLKLLEGGSTVVYVRMFNGDLQYRDSSGNHVISSKPDANQWVKIAVTSVDPAADTFSVYWETESGESGSVTGLNADGDITDGWESATMVTYGSGNGHYFDDYNVGGGTSSTGTYVGSPHSVGNAQEAWVNLSLSNADATVTWQGRSSGGSWSDITTNTRTSTGNYTVSVPDSYDEFRVEVVFDKTGSSPTAELHDEGVLFAPRQPSISGAGPKGGSRVNNEDVQLSANLGDADFATTQGDTVSVEIYSAGSDARIGGGDDTLIDSQTGLTGNQTVSTTWTGRSLGTHHWYIVATDEYGETTTTPVYDFEVDHRAATTSNLQPDGSSTNAENVQLAVDIGDYDFLEDSGDTVSVDFVVDGSVVATKTTSSNGTVTATASGLTDGQHDWYVETSDEYGLDSTSSTATFTVNHYTPTVSNVSPADEAKLQSKTITVSTDITDADFAESSGDTVTVEFQFQEPGSSSWTTKASQTVGSNTTTSDTVDLTIGGKWDYRVKATDEYGNVETSATRQLYVPSQLYIRNETNTTQLVDSPISITVRFFGDDQVVERSTTDGTVNLTGLNVTAPFIVSVDASEDYHGRVVYLQTIYQQQSVYLLNNNVSSVESRFKLEDPTGNYPPETVLMIKKPIKRNGTVTYRTVYADRFGVEGVTATLEQGRRYRLSILSPTGRTQDIGPYRADVGETVTVRPGSPTIPLGEYSDGWAANSKLLNDTLEIRYDDPQNLTTSVTVYVHEYGNTSNQLGTNKTFYDLGEFSTQYALTKNQTDTTWQVNYIVDRNGTTYTIEQRVENRPTLVPDLSREWRLISGILLLLISAGIFSILNAAVGGVIVAVEGGLLWYIGWLDGATTGAGVVIALFVSVLFHVYQSQSP